MKHEDQVNLLFLLFQNLDVFAWSPYEVLGVNPKIYNPQTQHGPVIPTEEAKVEEIS